MADSSAPYRKLPGRASHVISVLTLWEGDTHLLLVNSWPSGESYRRFFFSDIQAIILRRTKRRMVLNIVLGVLLLAVGAPLGFAILENPDATGWRVAGGVATGLGLVLMLINSLRGPACTMHIQTLLACEPIPTVRRLRRARRIIALIQPRITAAQPSASSSSASA